jgi:hypothetical protein
MFLSSPESNASIAAVTSTFAWAWPFSCQSSLGRSDEHFEVELNGDVM